VAGVGGGGGGVGGGGGGGGGVLVGGGITRGGEQSYRAGSFIKKKWFEAIFKNTVGKRDIERVPIQITWASPLIL